MESDKVFRGELGSKIVTAEGKLKSGYEGKQTEGS